MTRLGVLMMIVCMSGCTSTPNRRANFPKKQQDRRGVIHIKPHHFIDIITSYGRGEKFEPHPYGHAVHTVAKRILQNRDAMLVMELGADDICKPCKYNVNGVCDDTIDTSFRPAAPPRKQDWNLLIDKRWCKRLGLAQGDRLTVRQLCERLRDRAGDITDIYREIPKDMTAKRAKTMREGVRRFLTGA